MDAYQCMKVVAVIFLATLTLGTTFEAKAQMGVGSVIPALIWKDGTVKRNVTIQQLAGNTIILKVDGRLTPIAKQDFLKLYQQTQANPDKVNSAPVAAPPPPKKPVLPTPEQFPPGTAVSQLVWKDGTVRSNVKVIQARQGFRILNIDGRSQTISDSVFQELLKQTSQRPGIQPPRPVAIAPTEPIPGEPTPAPAPQPETTPAPTTPNTQNPPPAKPATLPSSTTTSVPSPEPPAPTPPPQPPIDGTKVGPPPETLPELDTDEEVRFTFMFTGDTQYPDVNDEPSPERMAAPEPVVAEAPVEEIDTSNWKRYGDEEPEEAVAKKITPLGVQWDKLMAAIGKGWQWFLDNIVWTGPVAGVLFLFTLALALLGRAKKKKKLAALQARHAEHKANRRKAQPRRKGSGGKGKGLGKGGGKFKKFKADTATAPSTQAQNNTTDHVYLCFTWHDYDSAISLQQKLEEYGLEVRSRDPESDTTKRFDLETVDNIESSQALILVASANAYSSNRVQQEVELAMEDRKKVIPVYLDATELPDHLEQLGYEETCVYFYPDEPEESMGEIIAYIESKGVKLSAPAA